MSALRVAATGTVVDVRPPTRSSRQNAVMWGRIRAFAEQRQWVVDGMTRTLTADEWKAVLVASFRRESVHVTQTLDGAALVMPMSTSEMSSREMSDFLDFLAASAVELGVTLPG